LHEDIPSQGLSVDNWGVHRKYVKHESGGYWDYCDFPLEHASEDEIANWPMPNPDDYDFNKVLDACKRYGDYAVYVGGAGLADVLNSNGFLRGVEQTLVDMITDDTAGLLLAKRRTDIQLEITRRALEAAKGRIDFLWMGEDLGTQIAPIIGPDIYQRNIKPIHQKFVDLAKSFDIPVMVHTCGSSSWAYEDFIEMGVKVVDTLQPEAANMAPAYLKSKFGGRLAFHGCISTAGPIAYGTVSEAKRYCEEILDIMMPGGGYCFAPTHELQDNTPTENVVSMYDVAKSYGTYQP
jgi:uroporphyrinogen decarboxylase